MRPDSDDALDGACSEIRAALPLFAGRDLDPDEHDAVQRHLDDCPACSLSLAPWIDLRGTLAAERARQERMPSPSLWGDVRAQLQEEGLLRPQPAAALPSAARAPRAVLQALAVAAAVVLAVVLSRPADQGASPLADGGGASQDLALGPVPGEAAAPEQLGSLGTPAQAPTSPVQPQPVQPAALLAEAPAPSAGRLRPLAPGDRGLVEDAVEILHTLPLRPGAASSGAMMLTGGQ